MGGAGTNRVSEQLLSQEKTTEKPGLDPAEI
jgi:hypothetical protein